MKSAPTSGGESTATADIPANRQSFARHLRAANNSPNTIKAYLDAVGRLDGRPYRDRRGPESAPTAISVKTILSSLEGRALRRNVAVHDEWKTADVASVGPSHAGVPGARFRLRARHSRHAEERPRPSIAIDHNRYGRLNSVELGGAKGAREQPVERFACRDLHDGEACRGRSNAVANVGTDIEEARPGR